MLTKFEDFLFEYIKINNRNIFQKLQEEGLKYFPNLHVGYNLNNKDRQVVNMFYINSGKTPVFTENDFKTFLVEIKLKNIRKALDEYIEDLDFSNTTTSCYFTINGNKIRLSDHYKKSFIGDDILVRFDSDEDEIITKIMNKYVNKV
jgi:hypothetical protein